jgi:16S rRNA (guanine527-N7)-methyltransferase
VSPGPEVLAGLEAYLGLLGRWNHKINLTALPVDPPTDEAVDRLIIEPLVAARHVGRADRLAIDIGSGGGSPAIPLKLAVPALRMVLVEVKVRKSAFLREVIRELKLTGVEVENHRYEELLPRVDLHEAADLVTVRAVRADVRLWRGIQAFLRPGGRVFWFGSPTAAGSPAMLPPLAVTSTEVLVAERHSQLTIATKRL